MKALRFQIIPPGEKTGTDEKTIVLQRDGRYEPEEGDDWEYFDNYFPDDRWDEVYDAARAIADSWYRAPQMGSLLSFCGIRLAGALQWEVFCFAAQVLRDLSALEEIAAQEAPDILVLPQIQPHWDSSRYDPGLTCALIAEWAASRKITAQPAEMPVASPEDHEKMDWTLPLRWLLSVLPDSRRHAMDAQPSVLITEPTVTRFGTEIVRLSEERGYQTIIADRGSSTVDELARSGITTKSWESYTYANVRRVHWSAKRHIQRAISQVPWDSVANQAGVPACGQRVLVFYLHRLCESRLPLQAERVRRVRDLADTCNLQAGIMCYAWTGYERLLIEALHEARVPTLTLIHGLVAEPRGYCPVLSDYVATIGDADRDKLIARGVEPGKIRSVGCPRFDVAYQYEAKVPSVAIDTAKRRILAVAQAGSSAVQATGSYVPTRQFVALLRHALEGEPDLQLWIRLHPADDITEAEKWRWHSEGIILAEGGHLYDWLSAADVVVHQSSTVGVEALFFDKPLVSINLTGQPDVIAYVEEGVAAGVYRQDDLLPAIRAALAKPPHTPETRERFIQRHACALDGKSSERVADLVERVANGRVT